MKSLRDNSLRFRDHDLNRRQRYCAPALQESSTLITCCLRQAVNFSPPTTTSARRSNTSGFSFQPRGTSSTKRPGDPRPLFFRVLRSCLGTVSTVRGSGWVVVDSSDSNGLRRTHPLPRTVLTVPKSDVRLARQSRAVLTVSKFGSRVSQGVVNTLMTKRHYNHFQILLEDE